MNSLRFFWLIFTFVLSSGYLYADVNQKDSILSIIKYQLESKKAALYHDISKLEQKPDSIRKYALLALKYAKKEKQKDRMGDAFKSIGASYHLASSYSNALAYYDSALLYFDQQKQANAISRTYSNKAGIFTKYRSLDSAKYNNEKSFEYAQLTDDKDLERIYLSRKANIYSLKGAHDLSINTLKELLKNYDLSPSSKIIAIQDIGINFYDMGMIDSALYYYNLVEEAGVKSFPQKWIILLNNKANVFLFTGRHEESIKCYLEAIRIADSINYDYGKSLIKSNLANLYYDWDKFEEAIVIYKESLNYLKSNGLYVNLATNLLNIGISYNSINNLDSSLVYLKRAEYYSGKIEDLSLMSNIYHNIGRNYFFKNNYDSAIIYYEKALNANAINENINTKANILHDYALSLAEIQNSSKPLQLIDSAAAIYKNIENSNQIVDVEFSKAMILQKMGRYEDAAEQLFSYIKLKDSVYSEEKFKKITELETKYKTAEKEAEIQTQKAQIAENELEINRQKSNALTYGILFSGALIISLIILIILLRIKQKHQLIKSELEQHSNELEGRLLRSQMNPHFIFNSLNSIQSYVTSNDPYHAEIYLSKFAKLMRSILENSRHAFVSLEQDLTNLMIYMELEELRFEGKFKQKIELDENIDIENTYIPPMMIQPYIENAIIHGLVNKTDNNGKLLVKFEQENDQAIKCIIEDNGIGRDKAIDLKSRGVKPYKSLGMQVTKERMEVISEINRVTFEEKISDLKNSKGESIGTKVELSIPIEKD